MRWEQSATSLNSLPGWVQRQRMRQWWTDFRKYKNCNVTHSIKKGFGHMAWKTSCVVQADRHTWGSNSGQGIKMMMASHWSQLPSSGPVCPASTLLWELCQIYQCNKFNSDLQHLRVFGRGSKEKREMQRMRWGRLWSEAQRKAWEAVALMQYQEGEKSTLELNWGFRNQDKSKMEAEAVDHTP